jgi:cytochrome o ubiquinol oxidase operon protein cyoD
MSQDLSLKEIQKKWHGTKTAYAMGCVFSLLLTAASFFLVFTKALSKSYLIYTVVALAFTQAVIQLLYFLHLGKEEKPQWESIVFYFMVTILLILVLGSLWIMYDLNQRVMPGM